MNNTNWIPTRATSTPKRSPNIMDFPSARHVTIEWDKLASIDMHDLNSNECSIEVLQEHLNHVAFCRPEVELNLDSQSGRRNMSKLFRLAQLIIQYLFMSQEYMEVQMNKNAEEYQETTLKYQQMKIDFQKQNEEFKKIKKSNKNLKETVTYLSSLVTSLGGLEHYRCPLCSKAFRSHTFLRSHLERKHPTETGSVDVEKCVVISGGHSPSKPTSVTAKSKKKDYVSTNSRARSNPEREDEDSESSSQLRVTEGKHETKRRSVRGLTYDLSQVDNFSEQPNNRATNNDVDTFELKEMRLKFDAMNDMIQKLSRDVEWQNRELKTERERREVELREVEKHKNEKQRTYEKTLSELNEKIISLQTKNDEERENKRIQGTVDEQKQQIEHLSSLLKSKDATVKSILENETFQKNEISKLKSELEKLSEQHSQAKKEFEERTIKERNKSHKERKLRVRLTKHNALKEDQQTQLSYNENGAEIQVSKSVPNIRHEAEVETKPIRKSFVSMYHTVAESTENDSEISRCLNVSDNTEDVVKRVSIINPPAGSLSEDYSSDKDTNSQPVSVKTRNNRQIGNYERVTSSGASIESEISAKKYSLKPQVTLKAILDANPGLWRQMREVVEMELFKKMKGLFGDVPNKGISQGDYKTLQSTLHSNRKYFIGKFKEFQIIRKNIEKEVNLKAQNRISQNDDYGRKDSTKSSSKETFKKGMKMFKQKMKKSNSDRNNDSVLRPKNAPSMDCRVVSVVEDSEKDPVESFDSESSSEASDKESPKTMKAVIHREVSKETPSHTPRLRSPLSSSQLPRRQSFFSNETYESSAQIESELESESDSEYEKVKSQTSSTKNNSLESLSKISEERDPESEIHEEVKPPERILKLKKTTNHKILELTNIIERKMMMRSLEKPAGAIDVFGSSSGQKKIDGSKVTIEDIKDIDSFDSE